MIRPSRHALTAICFLGILNASAQGSDPPGPPEGKTMQLTNFDSHAPFEWYPVNDNVMGGRSMGDFQIASGILIFAGATNTDGGGFASIRSSRRAMNLERYSGISLRVRGDGRTYRLRLETRSGVAYFAPFATGEASEWETLRVPFSRFEPRRRGKPLPGPPLDPASIEGLGLMIFDRRDGPFRLEVDWIGAY